MAKLKNPLLGLNARGSLGKALSFRGRGRQTIAEEKPIPKDAKSPAQLSQRQRYKNCAVLWHTLTPELKALCEREGTASHMTGFAWWQKNCLNCPSPISFEDEEGNLCACLSIFRTGYLG